MKVELEFTERYDEKVEMVEQFRPSFREQLVTKLESQGMELIQRAESQVINEMGQPQHGGDDTADEAGDGDDE